MIQHASKIIERPGRTVVTTLCGRSNRGSRDGMNIAPRDSEVTCKFCLVKMKIAGGAK